MRSLLAVGVIVAASLVIEPPLAAAPSIAVSPPVPSPHRIVALAPSLVEDLFALGLGERVVGVSIYADYPPAARRLPIVAEAASIDSERIVALRPELVVGLAAQAGLVAPLRRAGLRVILLPDDAYEDIFVDLVGDRA